jgi:plasmid stabilization system protein ParE
LTRYRVVVGEQAEKQIDDIDRWWLAHRRDAPDLFLDELNTALTRVADLPQSGSRYPAARPANTWRVLLRRSRYHVYYTIHGAEAEVRVRAVWYAGRRRGPRLG